MADVDILVNNAGLALGVASAIETLGRLLGLSLNFMVHGLRTCCGPWCCLWFGS